jgi:hypothetical protein
VIWQTRPFITDHVLQQPIIGCVTCSPEAVIYLQIGQSFVRANRRPPYMFFCTCFIFSAQIKFCKSQSQASLHNLLQRRKFSFVIANGRSRYMFFRNSSATAVWPNLSASDKGVKPHLKYSFQKYCTSYCDTYFTTTLPP